MVLHGQAKPSKLSVAHPGKDPTPLIFRPNRGSKGRNNFFLTGDAHQKSPTTTGNEAG